MSASRETGIPGRGDELMNGSGGDQVAGDEAVGYYLPPLIGDRPIARLSDALLAALRKLEGLSATASDVLDELGFQTSIGSTEMPRRTAAVPVLVGHALTLMYQPVRRTQESTRATGIPSQLAHHTLFRLAAQGDVAVISAPSLSHLSVFGGIAARGAAKRGLSGCIVDGGIRDLSEIETAGIGVWSRAVTPVTGKWRVEAAALNMPVVCGGVQVHPGDLVLADATGICFVPESVTERVVSRVLEICAAEAAVLRS